MLLPREFRSRGRPQREVATPNAAVVSVAVLSVVAMLSVVTVLSVVAADVGSGACPPGAETCRVCR